MIMHTTADGRSTLMLAANGHMDAMCMLRDHPSTDPAALMVVRGVGGTSALTAAAAFAAGPPQTWRVLKRSCAPLLLLLSRVPVEPQPSDAAEQAHMSKAMEALCQGPRSKQMFDDDQPDDARDECVHVLIARSARILLSPVVSRIFRELCSNNDAQLARVPRLINEAVVGMAHSWRQPHKLQDNA
ncbi:hypothetical protein FOA52_014586 [Chlamydomonas sp. UWO 241]|nr:hypothetical protein FOA52_014586 [Chlamydomonas sp. UWO 241]